MFLTWLNYGMELVLVNTRLLVVLPERLDTACAGFEGQTGYGWGVLIAVGQLLELLFFCLFVFFSSVVTISLMQGFLEALVGRKEVPSASSKYIDISTMISLTRALLGEERLCSPHSSDYHKPCET